jgi:predicted dehydrogenase
MSQKLRTAVIGVGHFGQRHVEKYAAIEAADLIAVADSDTDRAQEIAAKHGIDAVADFRDLFGRVDAVSICAPTSLHRDIAGACLENGLHTLIEKPIAQTVDEAAELIALAEAAGRVIQVGHLERFSPAYFAMSENIGNPLFIEANRISPFNPRVTDVSVVLDLMIHDIDLIAALVGQPIVAVDAVGAPVVSKHEDVVNTRVTFANGCVANLTASRISLKTERVMRIFQPDRYIKADLATRKVTVQRKGDGEMFPGIPNIEEEVYEFGEADSLLREIESFVATVCDGGRPIVDGTAGLEAVATAQKITDSLRAHRRMLEDAGTI